MAQLRTGLYGEYYGDPFTSSGTLTQSQMEMNAEYIYAYLAAEGWTPNAVAGLLGNMQHESAINPGRWQSDNVGNRNAGYSLVQWTPASKYIDWCGDEDPSTMDMALSRLMYELDHNLQFYPSNSYGMTFREFVQSKKDPYTLACVFAWNYERSYTVLYGSESEKEALRKKRGGAAEQWFTFLTDLEPPARPARPVSKRKSMSLLMMYLATRRRV